MKKIFPCILVAGVTVFASFADDGTYVYCNEPSSWHSGGRWWLYGISPSNGGIARLLCGNEGQPISQTLSSGFTLGGIVSTNNLSIKFAGQYPLCFIGTPTISKTAGRYTFSSVPLDVAEGATMVIDAGRKCSRDIGVVNLSGTYFGGAGDIELSSGVVKQVGDSSVCITDNSLEFNGGYVEIAPDTFNGDVSLSMSTAPGSNIKIGDAGGRISMTQGAANSVTLTMGDVVRDSRGTLTVQADSAVLGETQLYKFASNPSFGPSVPGYIALLGLDRKYDLLSYDSERGLIPAIWENSFSDNSSARVALGENSTENTISGNASALKIDFADNASFVNNGAITVGNGVDPAALILNWNKESGLEGTGTIDFGSSEGIIWLGSGTVEAGEIRYFNFDNKILGSNGITLVGRQSSYQPIVFLNNAQFSGPVHIQGCRLWISHPTDLPANVPCYVDSTPSYNSAQLFISFSGSFPNDIFLTGHGLGDSSDCLGALVAAADTHFTGKVHVSDDTTIGINGIVNSSAYFDAPISGDGNVTLSSINSKACKYYFNATNTWQGSLTLGNYATLVLGHKGASLGTGDVNLSSLAVLDLSNADGIVFTNAVTGLGNIIAPSTASFASQVQCGTLLASDSKSLSVSQFSAKNIETSSGMEISSFKGEATLSLGRDNEIDKFTAKIKDGAGVMSLEKKDSNTLVLHGAQEYSGATVVKGGVLKLEPQTLPVEEGLSWWLDADATDTMLFAEDGVSVTNWASRINSYSFGAAGTIPSGTVPSESASVCGTKWGFPKLEDCSWAPGHKVVRFYTNTFDRLYGKGVQTHRTLFFVTRTIDYWQFGGLFGRANSDYGLRLSASGGTGLWSGESDGSHFFDSDGKYWNNGKFTGYQFDWAKPQILVSEQSLYEDSDIQVRFTPAIGGYFTIHATNPFRPFGGEFAEVIAYNRILSDDERKKVEDYLARKWYGRAFYNTTPPAANVLPEKSSLSIMTGGVLDLNGVSTTVKSLDGVGKIINSGGKATLKVTGESSFSGTIAGNIELEFLGGCSSSLKLEDEASLKLGGKAEVSAYNPMPMKDGLIYWLDASKYDTFSFAEDGVTITNWASRIENLVSFKAPSNGTEFPPMYDASGMNGKPAVYFGKNNEETILSANASCSTRTLFIVVRGASSAETTVDGIWGPYDSRNNDTGIRFRNSQNTSIQYRGGGTYFNFGDLVRLNGVDLPLRNESSPVSNEEPVIFAGVYNSKRGNPPSGKNTIGGYLFTHSAGPRGMTGWIAEVIAYNRELSFDEVQEVELYLKKKWIDSASIPPENTQIVENGEMTFVVTADSNKVVVPAEWSGDIDVSKVNIVVDGYEFLNDGVKRNMLSVKGSMTGASFKTCIPDGGVWQWSKTAQGWSLSYLSGTCIIVR